MSADHRVRRLADARPRPRAGGTVAPAFATFLVLWVIVISSVLLVGIESAAFQQAAGGREALARVRSTWAARAGVEATLARLEYDTRNPDTTDAFLVVDDMADAARGTLGGGGGAEYLVAYSSPTGDVLGPADAHAKINVNTASSNTMMAMPYMTEDVADAILDWVDADDDVNPLGAEIGQYQGLPFPYIPRNAPLRSLAEMELILGVEPEFVRGEDWNLNGLLDAGEDDGDDSFPPDNRDGRLDAGWSGLLTTQSREPMLGSSGEELLDLTAADSGTLVKRLGIDNQQAEVVVNYAALATGGTLADFLRTDLNRLRNPTTNQPMDAGARALTREQLGALLNETSFGPPAPGVPGKLNINMCEAEPLEYLLGSDLTLADAIISERSARSFGFTSLADLLDVPGMTRNRLAQLFPLLTVRSSAYIATVRGRDTATGLETEIVATLDRSTLPVSIRELRIR
ncbi:MAG: general secretion pathway protein GspK [Phycisphaerales bacterium]|nr:general secretion pathway protein GspK [Phycisphaerales bacterium]